MAKNKKTKFITKDILKSSIIGSFQKLDPRYMIKNPVMFVVEIGCFITLLLTFVPTLFGGSEQYRIYNGIVTVILKKLNMKSFVILMIRQLRCATWKIWIR